MNASTYFLKFKFKKYFGRKCIFQYDDVFNVYCLQVEFRIKLITYINLMLKCQFSLLYKYYNDDNIFFSFNYILISKV